MNRMMNWMFDSIFMFSRAPYTFLFTTYLMTFLRTVEVHNRQYRLGPHPIIGEQSTSSSPSSSPLSSIMSSISGLPSLSTMMFITSKVPYSSFNTNLIGSSNSTLSVILGFFAMTLVLSHNQMLNSLSCEVMKVPYQHPSGPLITRLNNVTCEHTIQPFWGRIWCLAHLLEHRLARKSLLHLMESTLCASSPRLILHPTLLCLTSVTHKSLQISSTTRAIRLPGGKWL